MPGTRSVRLESWSDPALLRCSRDARTVYLALKCMTDDQGVLPWEEPEAFEIRMFPRDADIDVLSCVKQLIACGRIVPYTSTSGAPMLWVPSFQWDEMLPEITAKHELPAEDLVRSTLGRKADEFYAILAHKDRRARRGRHAAANRLAASTVSAHEATSQAPVRDVPAGVLDAQAAGRRLLAEGPSQTGEGRDPVVVRFQQAFPARSPHTPHNFMAEWREIADDTTIIAAFDYMTEQQDAGNSVSSPNWVTTVLTSIRAAGGLKTWRANQRGKKLHPKEPTKPASHRPGKLMTWL